MPGGPGGQLPLKAQIYRGILRLPAAESSDQGQYLCRALNNIGQQVGRAVLQVHGEWVGLGKGLGHRLGARAARRFSQSSACRGRRAQGPGEPRAHPGARRPHRQAVLQGRRGAQRHHHLEEGGWQPASAGEESGPPTYPPALPHPAHHLSGSLPFLHPTGSPSCLCPAWSIVLSALWALILAQCSS